MLRVLGVDPGMTGAAVEIGPAGELVRATTTPTVGRAYDVPGIRHIVASARAAAKQGGDELVVAIEEVRVFPVGREPDGRPKWGPPSSAQSLMAGKCYYEMAAVCYQLRVEIVPPKVWQAGIPANGAKTHAERKKSWHAEAQRRWPGIRKIHADAALIADQTRRRIIGGN